MIADTPDEALALVRAIEGPPPPALDDEPDVEVLDEAPGELKGIISPSPRRYYTESD